MANQPRLVNKQFNSPIGLYSQQNIQEVLDRETQILANGAVGINFHNPDVGKPSNLKNSAVLRMLEEEENRQRNGIGPGNDIARPLRENITWPPPEYEHKNSLRSTFKDVVVSGAKRVAWPPPSETGPESPYVEQNAVSAQGGPQFSSQSPGFQQNNYQAQAPAQQRSVPPNNPPTNRPLKPIDVSTGSSSPLSLSSPLLNQSPAGFRPSTPIKGWAPVHSPVATPTSPSWPQQQPSNQYQQSSATTSTRYQTAHQSVSQQTFLGQQYAPSQFQPSQPQYQSPQQQYQPPQQQYQPPQQQYKAPQQQYQPPQQQYQSPQPQQQYQPPQQQYQAPQQQYKAPQQQYQPPQQQYQSPQPQQQYQPPQQQYQPPQQQYQPPQQQYQPPQQQYQPPQQQYQPAQQQYQPAQQQNQVPSQQNQASFQSTQSAPLQAAAPSQVAPRAAPASRPAQPPPPSTITLRPNAPVSQAPPPVVTSQPATATLRGGKHLRGDLKWPPECVRQRVAEENQLLLELAQGPAVKPRRPNKDYTGFFAQHALNSTYPGYKIPPGTQFYRPV